MERPVGDRVARRLEHDQLDHEAGVALLELVGDELALRFREQAAARPEAEGARGGGRGRFDHGAELISAGLNGVPHSLQRLPAAFVKSYPHSWQYGRFPGIALSTIHLPPKKR